MAGTKNLQGGGFMAEHPLKVYEELDPRLLDLVNNTRHLALADGALPKRAKLLIATVLDAVHGASEGVQALAREPIKAGATKEEISEALRSTSAASAASTRQPVH
jgi:alkylhydroperoxidase/carboxymuconolactone decarboxylase family protein YurZ